VTRRAMRPAGRARLLVRRIGLAVAAIALLVGCMPAASTAEGRSINDLYAGFLIVAAVVAASVLIPATLAIVRFRRRREDAPLPSQTRGHVLLELTWTALPAITVIGLFIATFVVLLRVDATSAPRTTEIEVTGYRWGWSFEYPAEGVRVDGLGLPGPEVAVPIDEPITVRLTSADVIHSFFVPLFLLKRDANPGREHTFQFTVEEAGTYRGQCAEFCGLYHSQMPFTVVAMERPAYEAWLTTQRAAASAPPASAPPASAPPASAVPASPSPSP
jgi:cytochrome c oxidase subunit 2